jgi:hypothetical protein
MELTVKKEEKKSEFSAKKEENRVEIPVQHFITTTSKSHSKTLDNKFASFTSSTAKSPSKEPSSSTLKGLGKDSSTAKTFQHVSGPLEAKKKSGVTLSTPASLSTTKSSSEQSNGAKKSLGSKGGAREIPVQHEIPVQRVGLKTVPKESSIGVSKTRNSLSSSSSEGGSRPGSAGSSRPGSAGKGQRPTSATMDTNKEFLQVKLRPAAQRQQSQSDDNSLKQPDNPDPRRLSARQMSQERFERLKFDFGRGVPTENVERRGSEITDHIDLQLKVRGVELEKSKEKKEEAKPAEEVPKKEESIFAKGMKVSDFVKHINTVHPPGTHPKAKAFHAGGPKTEVPGQEEGDNQYCDMPDDADDDGLYEFVEEKPGKSFLSFIRIHFIRISLFAVNVVASLVISNSMHDLLVLLCMVINMYIFLNYITI